MVAAAASHPAPDVQVRARRSRRVGRAQPRKQASASEAGSGTDPVDPTFSRPEGDTASSAPSPSHSPEHPAAKPNGTVPGQIGSPAADAHSLSSDTHTSTGQDPLPTSSSQSDLTAASDPPTAISGTALSIMSPPGKSASGALGDKEKEKDSSTTSFAAPVGKRRRDGQSVSEGALTSSSLTDHTLPEDSKMPSKRPKRSLFSKFRLLCKSCVRTQHTHPVDLDEGASHLPDCEKHALKAAEAAHHGTQSSASTSGTLTFHLPAQRPLNMPPATVSPPNLVPLAIPTITDGDVIVPPTPTKQLLPLSETDGLTSGAVQPPGSTGENISHPHVYEKRVPRDEDSDSSFTEEGNQHDIDIDDLEEDEEQRLIRLGGAGIPTGPVSEAYVYTHIHPQHGHS